MTDRFPPPELRRDPVTSKWVILAAGRVRRPHAPVAARSEEGRQREDCPFCEGKEHQTPAEICACREGEGCDCPGWTIRVFPNKYPILAPSGRAREKEPAQNPARRPADGFHEVIVDSPFHNLTPWQMGESQVLDMLRMYRDRIQAHRSDALVEYVHIIRNHKAAGAASLEHPHSQLFGLPFIPPEIDEELAGFELEWSGRAPCLMCDVIADEERAGARVVAANDSFIAFCPFASRLPYECWIVPRGHQPRFEECGDLEAMAELMTDLLERYRTRLGDPPFNYWIHTYPLHGESRPYHWHLEIVPRITIPGGLEMGAGVWVNTVAPEQAAMELRGDSAGRRHSRRW